MGLLLTHTGKTVVTTGLDRRDPSCKVTGEKFTHKDNDSDRWADELCEFVEMSFIFLCEVGSKIIIT